MAADGSIHYVRLDFASAGGAKPRKVRVEFTGADPISVTTATTDGIWPVTPRGPRVIFAGDSYTGGSAMSDGGAYTWYKTVGELLGWDNVWNAGIGGTGYLLRAGGQQNNLLDRVHTDITAWAPDLAVLAAGHNDYPTYQPAEIGAQASAVVQAIRSASPTTRIAVIGPFAGGGPAADAPIQSAIFEAVAGAVDLRVDTCDLPLITGTGKVTAPAGNGNADRYIGGDGVHPTQEGHHYLGHRLAMQLLHLAGDYR